MKVLRHDLASDLVEDGDPSRLELELSDLGVPAAAGEPALSIDNVRGMAGGASASAVRPSLATMLRGTHCKLTAGDVEVFTLLARVLRTRICDDLAAPTSRCYDSALTILRDQDPGTYLLDLRTLGQEHGILHLRLEVRRDEDGAPVEGTFRVLPHSSLEKTANLVFTRPKARGEPFHSEDPGFTALGYAPPAVLEELFDHRVNLRALLEGVALPEGPPR